MEKLKLEKFEETQEHVQMLKVAQNKKVVHGRRKGWNCSQNIGQMETSEEFPPQVFKIEYVYVSSFDSHCESQIKHPWQKKGSLTVWPSHLNNNLLDMKKLLLNIMSKHKLSLKLNPLCKD